MRSLFLILLFVFTCLTDLRADMFADARALEKQGKCIAYSREENLVHPETICGRIASLFGLPYPRFERLPYQYGASPKIL